MESTNGKHQIVVGVNGSDNADRALHWAIDEAKLRDAKLNIVMAWHVPLALYPRTGSAPPASASLEEEVRRAAEGIVAAAAKKVREHGDLPAETTVVEGEAAEVLIDAAKDADLLVVGSRQRDRGSAVGTRSSYLRCYRENFSEAIVVGAEQCRAHWMLTEPASTPE
jgi:nucleotide-binding universal stress UspA family protein